MIQNNLSRLIFFILFGTYLSIQSCQVQKTQNELSGQICTKPSTTCDARGLTKIPELSDPKLPSKLSIVSHIWTKASAYYQPTEIDPNQLSAMFNKMERIRSLRHQVQIVVGSERGFLTSTTDYLILGDLNPFVRLYNYINIELLKISLNLETYRHLRFAKDFKDWQDFFNETDPNHTINQSTYFDFWHHAQYNTANGLNFNRLLQMPPSERLPFIHREFELTNNSQEKIPFEMDYVWNQERFARLQNMARQGHIAVYPIDFTKADAATKLFEVLKSYQLKVGIVDLSNIHQYVDSLKLIPTMNVFAESHIIMTQLDIENVRFIDGMYDVPRFRYFVLAPNVDLKFIFQNVININYPPSDVQFSDVLYVTDEFVAKFQDGCPREFIVI